MPKTFFKDSVGARMDFVLKDPNDPDKPLNLTNAIVTVHFVAVGSNTEKWSHNSTTGGVVIDDAANGLAHYPTISTDLNAVGDYYTNIIVTYSPAGNIFTQVGDFYMIVENQENLVPVADLLTFLQLPSENAPNETSLKMYLKEGEAQVNQEISTLATTTDTKMIQRKRTLIMIRADILYQVNLSENNVNPELRLAKIKSLERQYKVAKDDLNSVIANTSSDSGAIRRVYNSSYSDSSSRDYDSDVPTS